MVQVGTKRAKRTAEQPQKGEAPDSSHEIAVLCFLSYEKVPSFKTAPEPRQTLRPNAKPAPHRLR